MRSHTKRDPLNEERLLEFVNAAQKAVRLKGEVGLLLTRNGEMRSLNRKFLGKNKATDVLSFPAAQVGAPGFAGDLAISLDIATANARQLGHSVEDEVRVLILHGILHLAGYDHESDEGQMARKELRLRKQLGLPSSLTERSSDSNMPKKRKPRSNSSTRQGR